jgi:putative ABC transport system permease protein
MLAALLAVALGGTVFLGMGAVYYDIPRQMGREFRSYGSNLIFVASGHALTLNLTQVEKAASLLPADKVIGLTPFRYETMYYTLRGVTVVGTDMASARKTSPYWRVQGRWPEKDAEILLGMDVAEQTQLYAGASLSLEVVPRTGEKFVKTLTVSGILRSGGAEDGFILMPLSGLEALMGEAGTASVVEASIAVPGEELAVLAESIRAGVPGIAPRLVKRIADSETTVLARLRALVYLVTAVVLFLTMICVGATMMTVVMERRREIGLKKAIGAENKHIAAEFLGEGVLLAGAGALLGMVSGWFFARIVSLSVFEREVSLPFFLVALTLLTSLLVTLLASFIPVLRAMDVDPAQTLRGE